MTAMAQRWYLVHAHSGFEKRVAENIKENAEKKKLTQFFGDVVVPTETVMEVKKGKKVNAERKFQQIQEGVEAPKSSIEYHAGYMVKVTDGPFESFVGQVEEVDEGKNRL